MQLHRYLLRLRQTEKRITSEILDKLQAIEDCRGYLSLGYSSLFDYLVRGLQYSEATAYQRQACVRLAREVPEIKEKIDQGALSLSAVTTVYKHIRKSPIAEKRQALQKIEHKSTREVKRLFAGPLPTIQVQKTEYQDRVYVRLTLSPEQSRKLEKLQALKSHRHSLESLFETLIDQELQKYAKSDFQPSRSSNPRQIPKRLRNHVLKTADHQCQYPGYESTHFLQIDHIQPVRHGGRQNPSNLQVLCSSHNRMKG
jgi:hypothetical protein